MFGWMLRKYSGNRYYWELVITSRKMAVSLVFLLTTKYPVVQVFSSLVVVVVSITHWNLRVSLLLQKLAFLPALAPDRTSRIRWGKD